MLASSIDQQPLYAHAFYVIDIIKNPAEIIVSGEKGSLSNKQTDTEPNKVKRLFL